MKESINTCHDKITECMPFDRLWLAAMILQYVSGGLLILASVIRCVYILEIEKFSGIALTVYLVIFAAIFICTEASVLHCRKWFYFLNFGWGKGLAHIFVACIMLGSGAAILWLDVLVSIYLIAVAMCQPLTSVLYRESEREKVDEKLLKIEQAKQKKVEDESS